MQIYMPSDNPYIFGYDDLIDILKTRYLSQKMPQSILLHGPKGIGKATFAYHLARYLCQGQPENFQVSQASSLFAQVSQGACESLKVLNRNTKDQDKKTRTISIDSVRQIVQFLQTTARHDQWRIVIIDSVDELHHKAANALLKTLEEPPRKTLIILISHSLGRVLPTLKSRCWQFGKAFINEQAMTQAIKYLLPPIEKVEQDFYLHYAMGCPGRMISLMSLGGRGFYEDFLKVIDGIVKDDLRPALLFIDKIQNQDNIEEYCERFYDFFTWWLEHFLILSTQNLKIHHQESIIVKSLYRKHSQAFWLHFYWHTIGLFAETEEISLDRRAVLTSLFYKMAHGQI